MRTKMAAFLVGALLAGAAGAQGSPRVLYYCDMNLGTNMFPQALTELGIIPTVATSTSDFDTKLASQAWDLVILLIQNWSYPAPATTFPHLQAYLAGGGKTIFAYWSTSGPFFSWFGVSPHVTNQASVTFDATDPLAAELAQAVGNPFTLTNHGWGVFSVGLTPATPNAIVLARFPNGDAALVRVGSLLVNGMLKDVFTDPNLGRLLAKNEITSFVAPPDADGDGLPDWWEAEYGQMTPSSDLDGDGLTALQEYQAGTNPNLADTDGDGVSDGDERALGMNPFVASGAIDFVAVDARVSPGTVYFRFAVLNPSAGLTGFRVFYGPRSGTVAADYPMHFDLTDAAARAGYLDEAWGMQGNDYVYFRIAPIVGGVVGSLSAEASSYFSGTGDSLADTNLGLASGNGAAGKTTTTNSSTSPYCFIATAAYGSPDASPVRWLREFRDVYLLGNAPGRWFVATYYALSPPIARYVAGHGWARGAVKIALAPAVLASWVLVEAPPAVRIAALVAAALGLAWAVSAVRAARRRARA